MIFAVQTLGNKQTLIEFASCGDFHSAHVLDGSLRPVRIQTCPASPVLINV